MIDSSSPLELTAAREDRAAAYAAALHVYLRQKGVTTFFTQELDILDGVEPRSVNTPLATLCENLIVMRYAAQGSAFDRVLRIMKMRDSEHSRAIHEFVLETGKQLAVSTEVYKPNAGGNNS